MDIVERLSKLVQESQKTFWAYDIEFKGTTPQVVLFGTPHFIGNPLENQILEQLHPGVILHEELYDSHFSAIDDKIHHGNAYSLIHQSLRVELDFGPAGVMNYARRRNVDVVGIENPFKMKDYRDHGNPEREAIFFNMIVKYLKSHLPVFACVGPAHTETNSLLSQRIRTLREDYAIIRPSET